MDTTLTPTLADSATLESGVLTVGVNASNTPFGGLNTSNEIIGFDVDLAAALADELGLELDVVDVGSNGRSALDNGQVDVVMGSSKSGSDVTVSYSDAYINDGASLFCLSGNEPESMQDITGQDDAIIVLGESSSASTVQEALGVDAVEAYASMQDAFDALESGEHAYLVTDAVIGSYFSRDYDDIVRVDFVGADTVVPMYALTLTENEELTEAVSAALETVSENGVLRVVESKWLGDDGEALLGSSVDTSTLPQTAFGS